MADLYSDPKDGAIYLAEIPEWGDARNAVEGTLLTAGTTKWTNTTTVEFLAGKGGGIYAVARSFYLFDTSDIAGTVSAATIKIHGFGSAASGSAIAVKSTAFGGDGETALVATDFSEITGFSAGASLAGNATDYSSAFTGSWSNSGYNDLASTSDLRDDMKNNDVVMVCLMNYSQDYLNSPPEETASFVCGAYYTEYGSSQRPYITYTVSAGYGHNVDGVAAANIGGVDGVATANIEKVIGT